MKDETITCACGKSFIWPVRDQEFYKEKGFLRPRYCRVCRQERKNEKNSVQSGTRKEKERGWNRPSGLPRIEDLEGAI